MKRSKSNSVIGGVLSGLAKEYKYDLHMVRLLGAVCLIVAPTVSVILYLLSWMILEKE